MCFLFFSIIYGLIKGCVGDLMNNLIVVMNYLGFVENEYIMKGEFFILCKKKKKKIGNE